METILVDINAFTINLVEDHPGFSFIKPFFSRKNIASYSLKVLDIVPFRAFWILTKKWQVSKEIAFNLIESFVSAYNTIEYFGLNRNDIVRSFEFSKTLHHDI